MGHPLKILVTGANGQLGMELRQLEKFYPGFRFFFAGKEELSIADKKSIDQFFLLICQITVSIALLIRLLTKQKQKWGQLIT